MVDAPHVDFVTQGTDEVGNHALEELGEKTCVVVDKEKALRENDVEMVTEVSEETMLDRKLMSDVTEEKPLGEKASETSEMDVWKEEEVKEVVSSSEAVVASSESEWKEGDGYDYTWAAKYQPMALEDFICNKDIASQLKTMVRYT